MAWTTRGWSCGISEFDGFVAKIDPTGATLLYSTYLGGGTDEVEGIAVDSAANAPGQVYRFPAGVRVVFLSMSREKLRNLYLSRIFIEAAASSSEVGPGLALAGERLDQGTPAVRRGRKARGLTSPELRDRPVTESPRSRSSTGFHHGGCS